MASKQVTEQDAEEYFKDASDWDLDQVKRTKQSEARAWRVAFGAGIGLLLSIASNLMLFPLKEVQHDIIRVDNVTGLVDVQRSMSDAHTTYAEETDKYWLRQYVRTREGFLFDEYDWIYRVVGMLSSSAEQKKWYDFYRPDNPASPLNQFSNRVKVRVKIRSVTFIDRQIANVRFTKITEQANATPIESYWIATIKYRYVTAPATEADREINPLGFQVADYRVDPETAITAEVPK